MTVRPPRYWTNVTWLPFLFAILTSLFVLTSVSAVEWKGERVVKDGVVHVMNPAEPMEPPAVYELRELWRLESETPEGELVFALVDHIAEDESGNVYIADSGLKTVHVVSPTGEYLRSIGREGEGPGEFLSVSRVFLTDDGMIGAVDMYAGRIARFTKDGDPVDRWQPSLDDYSQMWIVGAFPVLQGYVAYLGARKYSEKTIAEADIIGVFDKSGRLTTTSLERITTQNRGEVYPGYDEELEDAIRVMGSAKDGKFFVSQHYVDYAIHIYEPNGSIDMIVEREYEPVERDERAFADQQSYWEAALRGRKNSEAQVSKYERSLDKVVEAEDGYFWIGTSRGWVDLPPGVADILDVYNQDGQFVRQAILNGKIDSEDDCLFYVNGKLYVFSKAFSAAMGAKSVSRSSADVAEMSGEESPAVTCCELIRVQ